MDFLNGGSLEGQQIIVKKDSQKISLSLAVLQKILLRDDIKDKCVSVISIAGPCTQGKSYLFISLLQYLNIRYKEKKNIENWLDKSTQPCFNSSMKNTKGILIWPEIFFAESPTGDQIAIILLDTQGSFDSNVQLSEDTTIFSVASLMSSLQIYNLKEGIKQYDLSYLKFVSDYRSSFIERKIFDQNMLILIRDWPFPHEFSYGIDGGQQYLNNILNIKEREHLEVISLKRYIKETYNLLNCFLLPYPGQSVANGTNLHERDVTFKKQLQIFGTSVLAPDKLILKRINGAAIKVADLYNLIENISHQLENNELPLFLPLSQSLDIAHVQPLVDKSIRKYEELMDSFTSSNLTSLPNDFLLKTHDSYKNEVLELFRNQQNYKTNTDCEHILIKKLEESFLRYRNINEVMRSSEMKIKEETQERERREREHQEMLSKFKQKQLKEEKQNEELLKELQRKNEEEMSRKIESRLELQRKYEESFKKLEAEFQDRLKKEGELRLRKEQMETHRRLTCSSTECSDEESSYEEINPLSANSIPEETDSNSNFFERWHLNRLAPYAGIGISLAGAVALISGGVNTGGFALITGLAISMTTLIPCSDEQEIGNNEGFEQGKI